MKYAVTSSVTVSIYTTVEANTTEEAEQLALERGMQSLCHQCASGDPSKEWSLSGELDGEPNMDDLIVEERG